MAHLIIALARRSPLKANLWIACLLLACCAAKPQGPITTAFDGTYRGNGYTASPPDWDCPKVMPADPLTVAGGEVSVR